VRSRAGDRFVERALQLGVDDRVRVAGLVAAAATDGLLALAVAPAGAAGDHLAVVGGRMWQTILRSASSWSPVESISPAAMRVHKTESSVWLPAVGVPTGLV
jgi:hypothetical protein